MTKTVVNRVWCGGESVKGFIQSGGPFSRPCLLEGRFGKKFPTIAGTGTEDYFCGSYDFDAKAPDGSIQYHEFTTPYSGLPQVIRGDGHYQVEQRFGLFM
jgi:hypothetical protein